MAARGRRYARDDGGGTVDLQHWRWGSVQTLDVSDSSARTATPLTGTAVFVLPDVDVRLRMGDDQVAAGAVDPPLLAGGLYRFPRAVGETHLAVVARVGGETGEVEVFEADRFVEDRG